MNSKIIFIFAAVFQGLYGFLLLLFPNAIINLYLVNSTEILFPQLFGAALIGFAVINWIVKNSNAGGIYGRPIVAGNMTFFLVSFLLFVGLIFKQSGSTVLLVNLLLMLIFSVLFILLLFNKISNKKT